MTPEAGARLRRRVFTAAVALCLVRPALLLAVELPRTPLVRSPSASALRSLYRPAYLDELRTRAPDGDVWLDFELPPGAEDLAALVYYQCTYELHPRRILVADRPVVINDGWGVLLQGDEPDPAWLAARGVKWRARFFLEGGGPRLDVRPVAPP